MASLSDLLVTLKGDASGFRAEMQSARQTATGTTLSIVRSFEQVEEKAQKSAKSIRTIGGAVTNLAGEAGGAVGQFSRMGNSLVSAFAGGPIVAGIAAVGLGITAIVSHYNEASEKAEANRKAQVDAWTAATAEIEKANEQLREQLRLSELLYGLKTSGAKTAAIAEQDVAAKQGTLDFLEARKARLDELEGMTVSLHYKTSAERQAIGREIATLKEQLAGYDELHQEAEAALRNAIAARDEARRLADEQGSQGTAAAGGFSGVRAADGAPKKGKAAASPSAGSFRALTAHAAAEKARQAEIAHLDLLIKKAQIVGDKDAEITNAKLRALKELEGRTMSAEDRKLARSVIDDEATKKRADLAKQVARERADYELAQQARVAAGTKSKVDDLQAALSQEVEAVKRKVEDQVLAEEEGARRISAIRARYSDLSVKQMEKEAKADLVKQDKLVGQALQAGAAAGTALIQGLKGAIEKGDAAGIAKGILGAAAGILTAFGGPLGAGIGQGLSMFAGMFAEGGIINGLAGDRNLILAADGEGIIKQSSMQKIGAPFFHRLNEDGVVDLSLLRKYASGGLVGRDASPAVVGSGGDGGTTVINLRSFDSVDALGGIRRVLGPATVYRNSLRQAEVERQSMSRWVR